MDGKASCMHDGSQHGVRVGLLDVVATPGRPGIGVFFHLYSKKGGRRIGLHLGVVYQKVLAGPGFSFRLFNILPRCRLLVSSVCSISIGVVLAKTVSIIFYTIRLIAKPTSFECATSN